MIFKCPDCGKEHKGICCDDPKGECPYDYWCSDCWEKILEQKNSLKNQGQNFNNMTTEWRKAGRFSFWATHPNGNRMLVTRAAYGLYMVSINGEYKFAAKGKTEAMKMAVAYAQV